jgi:DNA-binding CsgD family transcriptional regulator
VRQGGQPFSVIVLAAPMAIAAQIDAALHAVGARDVRYAASPADLLRRTPAPLETGVGIICGSPRSEPLLQLLVQLRRRGWRRLAIACSDCDDIGVRLAIAAKVRCLVRRPLASSQGATVGPSGSPDSPVNGLSAREVEVLQAVADGHTNNEIGDLLGLSGLTVKSHLARIGRKTGTGDRAEMVAMAMRAGLVA